MARETLGRGLECVGIFAISALAMAWSLAGAEGILGVDGYYHYRVAEEIAQRGPWVDISWLPFSVLGDAGPDHHWLFHLLLAPFTLGGHTLEAVQFAAICFAALVPAALVWVCRSLAIPYAPLVALVATTASAMLPARYLMLRTHGLALLLMALAALALVKQRHLLLGILAFAFMQFYHGAVVLVPLGALWLGVHAITTRELDSRAVVAIGGGLFLGLAASPWFPDNVGYLLFHTVFKMGHANLGLAGTEWYPPPGSRIVYESWPALLLLAGAGSAAIGASRGVAKPIASETWTFLGIALLMLALYKGSWRFVDYFAPFAVIAAALTFRDLCASAPRKLQLGRVAAAALCVLLVWNGVRSYGVIQGSPKMAPDRYQAIGAHLNQHGRPGDVVVNSHWPDFVQLVWHSPQFVYASGLDGHYLLYGDDEAQFDLWLALRDLENFEAGDDIGELLIQRFGARWLVLPPAHEPLVRALQQGSRHATLALADRDGFLIELHPPRTRPGPRR